jgi:2,3-diketo-5-methylthio-1-phosphopentane phosphatase
MDSSSRRVLVTDFDGTITKNDFYELVARHLLPSDTPDYWAEYQAGRITHFEALRGYFAAIRADEAAVLRVVEQMKIDPKLAASIAWLRSAGWEVVIASAGCRWYIERHLAAAGVRAELHANPGRFEPGQGLLMDLLRDSPFFSPTLGIDKAAVVRHYQAAGCEVAFAGDGFPDVDPSRLVPGELRFARLALAQVLTKARQPFHRFHVWSDIVPRLVAAPHQ